MMRNPFGGRAGMVHFFLRNESEDGNRASFPRWGKRSVISYHFTELVLEITVLEMHTSLTRIWTLSPR
jgi:hypothetical protein